MVLEVRELVVHLRPDLSGGRGVLLDARKLELSLLEHIRNFWDDLHSGLRKLREKLNPPLQAMTVLLKRLVLVSLIDKSLNIRGLDHEVQFIACSTLELNRAW